MVTDYKMNPNYSLKDHGHFPEEMDQMEDYVSQFEKKYKTNPDTVADWADININVEQSGHGWSVSFIERDYPTSDEAEAVAQYLRHTDDSHLQQAIRNDQFVDEHVEQVFDQAEEEDEMDEQIISTVVRACMAPSLRDDYARAVQALTWPEYKKDHPQTHMTRGEWEREYGPKTKKKKKDDGDDDKKAPKYREGWVEISPTKKTIRREDGTSRTVDPGEIIGPCRIDSPHRCMPKDLASGLSKEERVDYYKSKNKDKKKKK